jgi:hypothetical protein
VCSVRSVQIFISRSVSQCGPSSRQRGRPKTKNKAIFRQKKGKNKTWSWAPKGCPTPRHTDWPSIVKQLRLRVKWSEEIWLVRVNVAVQLLWAVTVRMWQLWPGTVRGTGERGSPPVGVVTRKLNEEVNMNATVYNSKLFNVVTYYIKESNKSGYQSKTSL